jgi:pSer/pThr/pTyr-binding forkhead associated (FHA) protein
LRARSSAELAELVNDLTGQELVTRFLVRTVASQAPRPPRLVLPRTDRAAFTIGHDADCDLVLEDLTVSGHHAELRRGRRVGLVGEGGGIDHGPAKPAPRSQIYRR